MMMMIMMVMTMMIRRRRMMMSSKMMVMMVRMSGSSMPVDGIRDGLGALADRLHKVMGVGAEY
jgi:hypothetical protein